MSDEEYMSHIIGEICDYAVQNEMEPDETIETISRNFLALLTISTFNEWKPKPQTNADRIRSMSDEELVKMMEDHGCCPIGACPYSEVGAYITRQDCEMCWLEWLKSPAEVDK